MTFKIFKIFVLQDVVGGVRQKRPLDLIKAEKNKDVDTIMVDPVS